MSLTLLSNMNKWSLIELGFYEPIRSKHTVDLIATSRIYPDVWSRIKNSLWPDCEGKIIIHRFSRRRDDNNFELIRSGILSKEDLKPSIPLAFGYEFQEGQGSTIERFSHDVGILVESFINNHKEHGISRFYRGYITPGKTKLKLIKEDSE